ncbi:Uncharacterized protein APZ42_023077 [Daphnia magna]|uniref:C2H2-type domain-containing protein n=1 Tax=Daphnia magna TaxID=35525 RepID=A0A164V8M0_9CRUS|nr:Uncharacterized protein APZ42_023077 [Daphnia magna]
MFWPIGDEMDGQSRVGCPNCHRTYKSNKFLYRHLRQGCGEIASGFREDQPCHLPIYRCADEDGQSARIVCPNCLRSYKTRRLLYRHLRQGCGEVASGYREDQPCILPVFRCQFCPYITFIRGFLSRHNLSFHNYSTIAN